MTGFVEQFMERGDELKGALRHADAEILGDDRGSCIVWQRCGTGGIRHFSFGAIAEVVAAECASRTAGINHFSSFLRASNSWRRCAGIVLTCGAIPSRGAALHGPGTGMAADFWF